MAARLPTLAIVGRPNVGKSTLFNRLVGRRQAIVHDQPGVTRDRLFATTELDPGRSVHLIDTGGLALDEDTLGLNEQVFLAIEESDLLIFVVDGREGLTAGDRDVWEHLRRYAKATVVAVNKGDTRVAQESFGEFFELGLDDVVLVSAEHGSGMGDLVESVLGHLPPTAETPAVDAPAVAIVGRPNVGKSSILNRVLDAPRLLVSPVAGTTRDPIDTLVERDGESMLLIDTAGIRRRAKVSGAAEGIAVMMARRQIERADLVVLVIDASQGVTTGDLAIGGLAWELGRPVVVAVNKWDLLDEPNRERLDLDWPRVDELFAKPPRVNVSATTGRGIDRLFPAIRDHLSRSEVEIGTGELNRLCEVAVRSHQPPADRGKPWKLYYATQVSSRPPTFMLFANRTMKRADTYRRYLENRLREALDLDGVPIRLVIRRKG